MKYSMNWWNRINKNSFYFLCFIFLATSCQEWKRQFDQREGEVIAEVDGQKLYKETLSDMDFSAESEADSIRFVEIYIDRWIRDKLLLLEARNRLEENPKVQELVKEYKNSLLLHEYEQQVIRERLDSNVSNEELSNHYLDKKDSYILNHEIYRARWIFTNSSNIKMDTVRVNWERNDTSKNTALVSLAELYAKSFNLSPNIWWRKDQLIELLQLTDQEWAMIRVGEIQFIQKEEGDLIIQLLEKKNKGDYAPLAYVRDNIKRFILHQRKEKILKKLRNDLYRSAVESNKIKIY